MRYRAPAFVLALALTGSAAAQTAELTPAVGYRTGGTLTDSRNGATFSIEPSWSWGFVAGLAPGRPNLLVEGTYLQQLTRVSGENAFAGGEGNLHDLRVQTALAGVQWDFSPSARVRPFVSVGIGATALDAQGGGKSTSFTTSVAGGVKLMMSRVFGARVQARAIAIFAGASNRDLCAFSDCEIGIAGWGTLQADVSLGTLFAF